MICYGDRAFCVRSGSQQCVNRECDRFLPPETDTNGLPVNWTDCKTDDCGYISNPVLDQLKQITETGNG